MRPTAIQNVNTPADLEVPSQRARPNSSHRCLTHWIAHLIVCQTRSGVCSTAGINFGPTIAQQGFWIAFKIRRPSICQKSVQHICLRYSYSIAFGELGLETGEPSLILYFQTVEPHIPVIKYVARMSSTWGASLCGLSICCWKGFLGIEWYMEPLI